MLRIGAYLLASGLQLMHLGLCRHEREPSEPTVPLQKNTTEIVKKVAVSTGAGRKEGRKKIRRQLGTLKGLTDV